MNNSISLIGMAGAGKSSVGLELAKQLNLQFVDSDTLIEAQCNQTLQSILDDAGYLKLREIEEQTILSIIVTASVGNNPTAVSAESITASAPSNTAVATSDASALVGEGESIIDSSI